MSKDECCNMLNLDREEIFTLLDDKVGQMGRKLSFNNGEEPAAVFLTKKFGDGLFNENDDASVYTSKIISDIKSNPIKEISSIINNYCTDYVRNQIEYTESLRERSGSRGKLRKLSEGQVFQKEKRSISKEKKNWNISTKAQKHCCLKKDFDQPGQYKSHYQSSKQIVKQVRNDSKDNGPLSKESKTTYNFSNVNPRPIEETHYQSSFKSYLASKNFKECREKGKDKNENFKNNSEIREAPQDRSFDLQSKNNESCIIKTMRNHSADPRRGYDLNVFEERVNRNFVNFYQDEAELLFQIFREIGPNQDQLVKKTDLAHYLLSNKILSEIYDIDIDHIHEILRSISGSDEAYLDFGEFVAFFKMPKYDAYSEEDLLQQNEFLNYRDTYNVDLKNRNLITPEELREMKKIFSCLDTKANFKVDRFKFISELRKELGSLMGRPAIYLGMIDKILPLGKILNQMEQDAFGPEELMKNEINWENFKSYFVNYRFNSQTDRFRYWELRESVFKEDNRNKCEGQEQLVISAENFSKLQNCFKKILNPIEGHVETRLLLEIIRSHPNYAVFAKDLGRQREEFFVTKADDIETVLRQIEIEADFFIDWDDFVDFFRRKGIPQGHMSKLDKQEIKHRFNIKTDFSKDRAIEDFYKSSLRLEPGAIDEEELRETLVKRVFAEEEDEIDMCFEKEYKSGGHTLHKVMNEELDKIYGGNQYGAANKASNTSFKITVPEPFNFREKKGQSIMQRRLEEDLKKKDHEKRIHEEYRFRANPAPAHVKDVNLLNKISKYDQNRRSQAFQSKVQQLDGFFFKPFEFLIRESNKPKKEPKIESPYRYVANPIPPICTVEIMARLKEEDERSRKERRMKWNEISMSLSKLPKRMDDWYNNMKQKLRSIRNGEVHHMEESQFPFHPEVHRSIPDFASIHRKNEDELQIRKLQSMKKTAYKPFNFSQTRRLTKRSHMDVENQYKNSVLRPKSSPTKYKEILREKGEQPKTTIKWDAHVERKKLEREQRELASQSKTLEEQIRLQRQADFSSIVRQSQVLKNDPIRSVVKLIKRENADAMREELRKHELEYNMRRKEIFDRVYSHRPLILEQQAQQNMRESKFRELLRMFNEHPEMQEKIIEQIENYKENIGNQEQQEIAEINNEEEEDR